MRLFTLFLLVSLTPASVLADKTAPRVHPQLQWFLHGANSDGFAGFAPPPFDSLDLGARQPVASPPTIRVLVQGDPLRAAAAVSLFGGKVLGYHGDTVHAEVSAAQLRLLMQETGIATIAPSRKLRRSLDVSRQAIHADAVQAGTNLPQPYTGKGVIVGIVDTGIDIDHPDFKNSDGSTRILAVWDQTYEYSDGFRKPAGYDYGVECTAENINAANAGNIDECLTDDGKPIDDVPTEGHGTHVAGVAAGSDATYRGIAPDATLVIVRAHFEEGSILDGVDYVFAKCQEYNRPCVVNLSLGTTAGAHDGTSLIEQKLSEKTGPGRLIVAAAGNEAVPEEQGILYGHAIIPFAGNNSGNLIKGPILVPNPDLVRNDDFSLVLDVWANDDTNRSFYIAALTSTGGVLTIHNGPDYLIPPVSGAPINQAIVDSQNTAKTLGWVHLVTAIDPANNRRETLVHIDRCSDAPCSSGGKLDTAVSSLVSVNWAINSRESLPAGQLDLWPVNTSSFFAEPLQGIEIEWQGVPELVHNLLGGDNLSTITIPATSREVIAVGSYITKLEFTNADGKTVIPSEGQGLLGELSVFSSRGPATGNVGVKPDIVAPGQWIASAHSTNDNLLPRLWEANDFFIHLQGTSMASPHVTGVLALMLQKNGQLTPAQVLGPNGFLTGRTQTTPFTGSLPNTEWGYGVVDASAIFAATNFLDGSEPDVAGPEIKSIRKKVSGSKVTLSWTTNEPSTSVVALAPQGGGRERRGGNQSFVKSHSVVVSGLSDGTTYGITVESTDLAGNTSRKSGGTVVEESSCGCGSRDGMTPLDALPFMLLGLGWVLLRLRSNLGQQ